jgi:hypothetical protein
LHAWVLCTCSWHVYLLCLLCRVVQRATNGGMQQLWRRAVPECQWASILPHVCCWLLCTRPWHVYLLRLLCRVVQRATNSGMHQLCRRTVPECQRAIILPHLRCWFIYRNFGTLGLQCRCTFYQSHSLQCLSAGNLPITKQYLHSAHNSVLQSRAGLEREQHGQRWRVHGLPCRKVQDRLQR